MQTGSSAFLDALIEAGVTYLFANLGSDHTGLIEAYARACELGQPVPRLITCPNEMVALSAAHGFAQVTGTAQAVIVHVECGTQALGGALHNVAKGRIPVLIFAGASPFTQRGELNGSRNEFIQWIQDVPDQRGLVRGYTKYDNEFRTARNIKQITRRALQFAHSDPKGPVYLMGAREIMEAVTSEPEEAARSPALSSSALSHEAIEAIALDLRSARFPLIVTSYLGRNPRAVSELVLLCDRFGIGVLESVPSYMNFPHSNALYQGSQWNAAGPNPILAQADVILVVDSDVPWIPLTNSPGKKAKVHHIDVDPLKNQMPLSVVEGVPVYQADAEIALAQLRLRLESLGTSGPALEDRYNHYTRQHRSRRADLRDRERSNDETITPEALTACVRGHVGTDTLVLNEGISNYKVISDHLSMSEPGSLFTSGGGSLGWNGGAAIGMKLACPEKTVIALAGDGSYLFSIPSTVHWMARRYKTPFLQIIYNNGGWKSPKLSTLAIHPDGYASRARDIGVSFEEQPNYAAIAAAAAGAFAQTVTRASELEAAVEAGIRAVRVENRAAVLDVQLPRL